MAVAPQPNKVEILKQVKDGLDVLPDIYRYAELNDVSAVTPDDMDRFKWYGLYHDKPKNGRFMLRVKVPGGIISSAQLDAVAELASTVATERVELTTRQDIQLHGIELRSIPHIFETLNQVGLTTVEACGDVPRNVVSSPVAGIAADEWLDPRPFIMAVQRLFHNNREYSNLPRKYKTSIAGGPGDAAQSPINDLALTPAYNTLDGQRVLGFNVVVGGGLSNEPHLADDIDVWVPADEDEVVELFHHVTLLFRDYGYREKRTHARLKFLLIDWGAARFRDELERSIGRPLQRAGSEKPRAIYTGDFLGVHPQKQPGLFYVGLLVPTGRITPQQMRDLAQLARVYGDCELRLTNNQNVLITNVPQANIPTLLHQPLLAELKTAAPTFQRHVVACTALPYCNYATIETKERAWALAQHLDAAVPLEEPIRIHLSACPHSCAQHHIGDIGLQGGLARVNGVKAETADLLLGGALGDGAQLARKIALKVPWTELPDRLTQLLSAYKAERGDGQSFNAWVGQQSDDQLRSRLGLDHERAVGNGKGVWDEDDGWNRPAKAPAAASRPAD